MPIGKPACPACASTTKGGLEWPALASGEERTISATVPITGSGQTTFFASLYPESLANLMAAEATDGISPGQQTWKIALTIRGS